MFREYKNKIGMYTNRDCSITNSYPNKQPINQNGTTQIIFSSKWLTNGNDAVNHRVTDSFHVAFALKQ